MKTQFAIAQHPMYWILKYDTKCAECIPPWGTTDLGKYMSRIGQNLDALRKHSNLRVTFDYSGAELEDIAEHFPEIIKGTRELLGKGQVALVSGTYAQPHFHVIPAESCYRQIEYGQEVVQEIFGYPVRTMASTEPLVGHQLPQLLAAFGYTASVAPRFPYAVTFIDECEMLSQMGRL